MLLCQLTYKQDWDLPGGVVEVGESPQLAVAREVEEELGLEIAAGPLLLTDWLPPWGGWDDALCLVFDGGTHEAAVMDRVVKQPARSGPRSSAPSSRSRRGVPTSRPDGSGPRWTSSTAAPAGRRTPSRGSDLNPRRVHLLALGPSPTARKRGTDAL